MRHRELILAAAREAGAAVIDGIRESLLRRCVTVAPAGRPAELGADAEVLGAVESLLADQAWEFNSTKPF